MGQNSVKKSFSYLKVSPSHLLQGNKTYDFQKLQEISWKNVGTYKWIRVRLQNCFGPIIEGRRRKRVATKLLKRLLTPVSLFVIYFFFLRKDKSVELLLCGTGTNAATDGCMVRLGKY